MKMYLPLALLSVCLAIPSFAAEKACRIKLVHMPEKLTTVIEAKTLEGDKDSENYLVLEGLDNVYFFEDSNTTMAIVEDYQAKVSKRDNSVRMAGIAYETTREKLLKDFADLITSIQKKGRYSPATADGSVSDTYTLLGNGQCSDMEIALIAFLIREQILG